MPLKANLTKDNGGPVQRERTPVTPDVRCACQFFQHDSLLPEKCSSVNQLDHRQSTLKSRARNVIASQSDHEYEIIEKPACDVYYGKYTSSVDKTDYDELSSNTSLGKYVNSPNDGDQVDDDDSDIMKAGALQRDIEERYFLNTPSTISRTECDVNTSQVESSALENLPLKRDSRRSRNADNMDSKIRQKFKEGTGIVKTQAGKLKTRLQTMNTNIPERAKFKFPDRPKFTMPERPKFTLPDKRKFSLPDRPKFKKINISGKLTFGDRKKFSLPERPKFNVPDLPKFKIPERPKLNFPSISRKKHSESTSTVKHDAGVDFEAQTYPRLFSRKKQSKLPKTSSSPTLNREDTPPPTFKFIRVKKTKTTTSHLPGNPELVQEHGNIDNQIHFERVVETEKQFETKYDINTGGVESKQSTNYNENSSTVFTPIKTKVKIYSHTSEIHNDEPFVRPTSISRENIQVREYLSDEIRQAFKIPKNILDSMGSDSRNMDDNAFINEAEADPELLLDENEAIQYSTEDLTDRDDGYYTFPPVRPSRSKRKNKDSESSIMYIDDNVDTSLRFSEVELKLIDGQDYCNEITEDVHHQQLDFSPSLDLNSGYRYANDDILEYAMQPRTLPMPPKRKKKFKNPMHTSMNDFIIDSSSGQFDQIRNQTEDIITTYRTDHEYVIPEANVTVTGQSPLPPRRNRSRSSRGTSLCDDDRTSHGAESLALDTHIQTNEVDRISHESPVYTIADKVVRRSASKTPPIRRRKSNISNREYYTVGSTKPVMPGRPPRKKSSSSLVTLDKKLSISADLTQYVDIDEPLPTKVHKDLSSSLILSKMKDRPLPPPPRPPRGSKQDKMKQKNPPKDSESIKEKSAMYELQEQVTNNVMEIEVSTQTDRLPDDFDYELAADENLDDSMTSSLRDVIDEDFIISKGRISRPGSRLKMPDPKVAELTKPNVGRTSPTVILVERRVSSPTRINERNEILTEASLTVQHIDIDESQIPDVPPLPEPNFTSVDSRRLNYCEPSSEDRALERVSDTDRDVQLSDLVTQRLQVKNLDVSRLSVSELQASKILVSEVEGLTLQVNELDTKSGKISVSGIDFSQSVIDEIVKKFSEITTSRATTSQAYEVPDNSRPISNERQTQTDVTREGQTSDMSSLSDTALPTSSPKPEESRQPQQHEPGEIPPQRPPPPDLTPLLYSYLHGTKVPPSSLYPSRQLREMPFSEFYEYQSPPVVTRRGKRKPATAHSDSSSEQERLRPSPRRMPPSAKAQETTVVEAGTNFLRVCQSSVSRTLRNMFNSLMSYISTTEDKKDVQMALVIFLVLVAGLVMFGLSDSRTIHHHHWEFFNPPDSKQ